MKALVFLIPILLFVTFFIGAFYSSINYLTYRDLIPKPPVVGWLSRIRASMIVLHDPRDPNVTDECRGYFRRYMLGNGIAISALILFFVFLLIARAFDLQRFLE